MNLPQTIQRLLSPSAFSLLVTLVVAVALTGGVIVSFVHTTGDLRQQLLSWQQNQPIKSTDDPPVSQPGEYMPPEPNSIATSWPLIVVWAVVGLVVYSIASYIMHGVNSGVRFKQSLNYVNARPKHALETLVEQLILRIIASIILIWLLILLFRTVIPYVITIANISASDIISLDGALYAVLSAAVLTVSLHMCLIFLRLSLGKTRVF